MKNNQIIISVVIAGVVGTASFFGGMKYAERQPGNANSNRQFGNRQGGGMGQNRPGGLMMGRPVMGEIISQDDKSITVKLTDGSSKIVLIPDSITVSKTDTALKSDLKVGVKVGVFGSSNSDGSVTAQNIQLNPMFRMQSGGTSQGSSSGTQK